MDKNVDLTQILKDCPKGTKLFCVEHGYVELDCVDESKAYPIIVKAKRNVSYTFTKDGYTDREAYRDEYAEPSIYPAHDQRDWSKFKVPKNKVKVTLHPFDKVLAWSVQPETWVVDIFSHYDSDNIFPIWCIGGFRGEVIPYNKDTAHLLGTSDKPEVEYEIEFSKEFKKK